MPDTLTIGSTSPLAIAIAEPLANPEKPGDGPAPRTAVIGGMRDGLEGVTTGVDASLYHAWLKANPTHPAVENGLFREIRDGESDKDPALAYGFEPGLKAAAEAGPGKAVGGQKGVPETDTSTGRLRPPVVPQA